MIKSPIAMFVGVLTAPIFAVILLLAPMNVQSAHAKTPVPSLNLSQSGLALRGYDPVAYFKAGKPVKGSKNFAGLHSGGTYYFSSQENKVAFQNNPAKYLPQSIGQQKPHQQRGSTR